MLASPQPETAEAVADEHPQTSEEQVETVARVHPNNGIDPRSFYTAYSRQTWEFINDHTSADVHTTVRPEAMQRLIATAVKGVLELDESPRKATEAKPYTSEELRDLLSTRYQISHFFNELLADLLERMRERYPHKTKLIETLEGNLSEEEGAAETEYGHTPHDAERRRLMETLGFNYNEWQSRLGSLHLPGTVHPAVAKFISGYQQLINEDPLAGYAGIAYWEDRVSRENGDYARFLHALEKAFPMLKVRGREYEPTDALWHLHSHAVHDQHHAEAFRTSLINAAEIGEEAASIRKGMETGKKLWDGLWQHIADR